MTCSTSTTSTMAGVGMLTLDCRPTEPNAGCTTILSESFLSSTSHTDPVLSSSLALTLHPLTSLSPSSPPWSHPLPPTRLIVIAEKKTVYEKFPTPLINRLEKHFVLTSSVLTEEQQDVLHQFQDWIQQFASVSRTSE